MEPEHDRRKIEETVKEFLKTADLDKITESNVRAMLADRLNIDISDVDRRKLVRSSVESYLLSLPEEVNIQEKQPQPSPNLNFNSQVPSNGRIICKLSSKRNVSIHNFREKTLVSLRDYYRKDGKQFPSPQGITLTANQWSAFRKSVPAIEEAIVKMQSWKRKSECVENQREAAKSQSVTAVARQGEITIDRKQAEGASNSNSTIPFAPKEQIPIERQQSRTEVPNSPADFAPNAQIQHNSVAAFAPQEEIPIERRQSQNQNQTEVPNSLVDDAPNAAIQHNSVTAFPPDAVIPIETSRLNGTNYSCWMHQMYFFLKQMKIAYVLSEPCPTIPGPEEASFEKNVEAKATARKWAHDDYICRRNILSSLSDHLFFQYSKKTQTAKDLWEELRICFDEDFGTKRSQVNKYLKFQMVDGISVLDQVQELHEIADSINAYGMRIDENFHVSAIVSKLPPSWKDCCVKLMHEEFLPLNKLMYILRIEEESRNGCRTFKNPKNAPVIYSRVENKFTPKKETKRLCYTCGKEGHIFKNCPVRKYDHGASSIGKVGESVAVIPEVNMVEKNTDVKKVEKNTAVNMVEKNTEVTMVEKNGDITMVDKNTKVTMVEKNGE